MCVHDCGGRKEQCSLSESLRETDCTHSWEKHWAGLCSCVMHMCPPSFLCALFTSLYGSMDLEPHDSAGWSPQPVNTHCYINVMWSIFLSESICWDKRCVPYRDAVS